jgi:hypothetical protein
MAWQRGLRAFNRDDSGLREPLGAFPPTDTVFVILGCAIVLSKDEQWFPELARWMAIYPLGLAYQAVLSPEREAGSTP